MIVPTAKGPAPCVTAKPDELVNLGKELAISCGKLLAMFGVGILVVLYLLKVYLPFCLTPMAGIP